MDPECINFIQRRWSVVYVQSERMMMIQFSGLYSCGLPWLIHRASNVQDCYTLSHLYLSHLYRHSCTFLHQRSYFGSYSGISDLPKDTCHGDSWGSGSKNWSHSYTHTGGWDNRLVKPNQVSTGTPNETNANLE